MGWKFLEVSIRSKNLDVSAESKRIQEASEKGEKSIVADNIYGVGWSTYGTAIIL